MHFHLRFSFFIAAASLASAQIIPPADTTDTPVVLDNVIVTASPFERSQAGLTSATTALSGLDLRLQQQASLGETLGAQTGMSSTYFGPGASRPIIRGLGGDRVRILANGVDTIDASTTSPDHAVSLDPFLVKRIEIVRGPASLLYGSSAVGGVVNVIDHRIETELPTETVSGEFDSRYNSGDDGITSGGIVDVALFRRDDRAVVLHLDGFDRQSDDVHIPGFANPSAPTDKGRIPNTAIDSSGGSVGLSYVSTDFNTGLNYNGFNTVYGVPNEPDVEIDMKQRRVDFAAELKRDFGLFTGARFKAGIADYTHKEIENGTTGTQFTNEGFNTRIELLHENLSGFSGSWGAEINRSDFSVVGDEAFLPATLTGNVALFAFEETKTGAVTWQFGARYEHQRIEADAFTTALALHGVDPSRVYDARTRTDDTVSLSGGAIYKFNATWSAAFSATLTGRAPNAQELYADGPHLGTDAYEIGNDRLAVEKSIGLELGLRKTAGFVTGSFSLFANAFNGYIYDQATGTTIDYTGAGDVLPVYQFVQRDALFYGAELETRWHLHQSDRDTLDLKLDADYTVAQDSDGNPLPRIPPLKGTIGLAWSGGSWSAGTDWQLVARQDRTAANETETAGYTLLSVYANYRFVYGPVVYEVFVRGSNLTDEDARVHSSFLKDIAPLPGRSVTLGLRAAF